jgi:hypothetical protein
MSGRNSELIAQIVNPQPTGVYSPSLTTPIRAGARRPPAVES